MTDGDSNLVLPFAVIEREGAAAEEFPLDMTLATVLADVEMRREKAGMLRKREEMLEFTSLLYWPILVAPWREDRHLVFDCMGVWSYVFSMGKIPDAKGFASAVEAAPDYRALLGLLNARATFFDNFPDIERVPVMGLFIHEEFMRDVLLHAALAKPRQMGGSAFLTPRLSPDQANEAMRKMRDLLDSMARSREALGVAGRALEQAVERTRQEFAALRDRTMQTYATKTDGIRADVTAQVASLEHERDERWSVAQPKLLDLQAATRKAEADVQHWDFEMRTNYGPDQNAAAQRLQQSRAELAQSHDALQRYQNEMAQARSNYDRQVQAQWDRIRELERERDAEIARLNQDEQTAAGLAGKISTGIAGLTRQLDESAQFLVSQGVPAAVRGATVVRMPIIVASFVGDRGRRIVVYPPMVARAGKGVLGSLKSTFGGAVLPLEPKTTQFEQIFRSGIERAVAEDASLAAYLASVGNSNNLLHLANLREMLGRGLAGLRAQGWIKDKHERELVMALERHVAIAARTAPRTAP